jgi:hypothetical protein
LILRKILSCFYLTDWIFLSSRKLFSMLKYLHFLFRFKTKWFAYRTHINIYKNNKLQSLCSKFKQKFQFKGSKWLTQLTSSGENCCFCEQELNKSRGRRDCMVVALLPMQSVPITTNVVSSNPIR